MAKEDVKVKKPKEGEDTGRQAFIGSDVATIVEGLYGFYGFGKPMPGTYLLYRKMRRNPTIALARSIATAPIRTAKWSVTSKEGVPEERELFIKEHLEGLWPEFLRQLLYALDYGWMPFEKVWEVNSDGRWVYRKLKPLLVDKTKILIDPNTGVFLGIKQSGLATHNTSVLADLSTDKCFVYSYDAEAGNYYGRSRHENIRDTAYTQWSQIAERSGMYSRKIAGIIPMIEYPEGTSLDRQGTEVSNFDLSVRILQSLGKGSGVSMPNTFSKWAEDLARSGVNLADLKSWKISFLESKGNHAKGFSDTLRHLESLMMRGWLVPERAGIEGQFGTKAESQVHGNIALVEADLTFEDILRAVNWYLVNPLLVYNFGVEAENSVWLENGGVDPILKQFLQRVMEKVLTEPANIDLFLNWLEIDSMLDNLGLPTSGEPLLTEVNREGKEDEEVGRAGLESLVNSWYQKLGCTWKKRKKRR